MPNLTKTLVDNAKPKPSRYFIWDTRVIGLGLVVQPSGAKSFCYQWRTEENRTRRMSIGRFSDSLTVKDARDKALELARQVADGHDPLAHKQERRRALTVSQLLDRYMASAKFAEKADSTRSTDVGRIERHLKPLLGSKVADKLTTDEIRKAQRAIEQGKTAAQVKTGPRGLARVTGGEGAARMSVRLLKAVYGWAIDEGLLKDNPVKAIKLSRDGQRDQIIESTDQYKHIFETIQTLEDTRQIRQTVADAIRMIALTGARRGEIASLRWRHVDLKKGVAALPMGEHKTGKKTGQTRVIGLPAAAQAIIARQAEGEPDDFIFPPSHGKGPVNLSKPWRKIRDAAGLHPEIGLHGLRHSLATHMAIAGAQAAQIMAVMGHRDMATSQRYVHMAQDIRSELAEKAASGISAALTGGDSAELIKLGGNE